MLKTCYWPDIYYRAHFACTLTAHQEACGSRSRLRACSEHVQWSTRELLQRMRMIGSSNYPYSLHRQRNIRQAKYGGQYWHCGSMVVLPLVSRKSNLTVSFFVVSLNFENLPYILQWTETRYCERMSGRGCCWPPVLFEHLSYWQPSSSKHSLKTLL